MRNLEAKFKLFDLDRARKKAEAFGCRFTAAFHQRDTFFKAQRGKLKLREEDGGAWLIHYGREDSAGLKLSSYEIIPVAEPDKMRAILSEAMGVLATVRKHRTLLQRENLRLHLDSVDGLGDFGEIEAVVGERENPEAYRPVVDQLLDALEVRRTNLIGASYFEILRPVK